MRRRRNGNQIYPPVGAGLAHEERGDELSRGPSFETPAYGGPSG